METKNNEFAFSHIEDMASKVSDSNISFGFQIFASYLKMASLFKIIDNNMWIPIHIIYDDINGQENLDAGLDESTPNEDLHNAVHAYVNAYIKKGIFEKKKLAGDEMICMVNPTDVETLIRFVDLVSISWGAKAKTDPKKCENKT